MERIKFLICYSFAVALLIANSLFGKDSYDIDHASVSIYAVDSHSGRVLIDKNSDLSLIPASCLKIVTTAAALHLIGPDYRFKTVLEQDSLVDAKTLRGNIYIRGGGDPTLGSDRIEGVLQWEQQIAAWADAIQFKGIEFIEGKIIVDTAKWENALAVPSWTFEDLGNYYGTGASALSFHENSYTLFFKPSHTVGESAHILRIDPPLPDFILRNEVKTGAIGSGDGACIYGSELAAVQVARGTIPSGVDEFAIRGAIPDPAACVAHLLTRELQRRGVIIEGKETSSSGEKIHINTTYSPPLHRIIYWTNHKSINLYAEHFCKKMGEITFKEGSTVQGVRAINHFLESKGIPLEGMNIQDGSGLSRKNLMTARTLVELLLKMKQSELFPLFFKSLPQKNEHTVAKSGSMSFVKGCAGYSGEIAFAILINNCTNQPLMNEKIDLLLKNLQK